MPYTLTHVIAIVPFSNIRWLPFSALVIGSMIPDLPHFADVGVGYTQMHSLHGIFTYCLLFGAIGRGGRACLNK